LDKQQKRVDEQERRAMEQSRLKIEHEAARMVSAVPLLVGFCEESKQVVRFLVA
jgi:hypothetical protein